MYIILCDEYRKGSERLIVTKLERRVFLRLQARIKHLSLRLDRSIKAIKVLNRRLQNLEAREECAE